MKTPDNATDIKVGHKTPDEIQKALECCVIGPSAHQPKCGECPYKFVPMCSDTFLKDALALTQLLEADNAQKDRCIENLTDKLNMMGDEVMALSEERGEIMRYLRSMGCDTCLYDDYDGSEPPCINCTAERDLWQWEGVQKEDGDA